MRSTSKGLTVWDLSTDAYSHAQLAANWDLVDSYWTGFDTTTKLPKQLRTSATVPGSGTAGDLVMLTGASGGFAAWTILRYDGSAWRPVGPLEILAAVPTLGNFPGRLVILSATDSGFAAWSVIRYDGSAWAIVGGFSNINTGAGSLNISGLQTTGDVYYSSSARGPVMVDRVSGAKYRVFMTSGKMETEVVT